MEPLLHGLAEEREIPTQALYRNLVVFDAIYSAEIWRYLQNETRNLTEKNVVTYLSRRLGWQGVQGSEERRFLLGESRNPDGSALAYRDGGLRFVKGDPADYQDFLKKEIYGKIPMEFALIAGLTSIVSGFVAESTGVSALAINISSQSTSGKTTMLDFIGSLYGSPSHSNSGLVRTFNATKNAIMATCEGRNGIPIILDDINGNASEHNRIDLIMQLAAGTSRGRCDASGAANSDRLPWHGVAFITSESPIFDGTIVNQGIQARCLVIDGLKWTTDAGHSDRIKAFVASNYGHIAPEFAEKVAEIGEEAILEKLEAAKQEILGAMERKDHMSSRLADEMAPFLVTARIYKDNYYARLKDADLINVLVAAEQASHEEGSLADRVMEKLNQFIIENVKHFNLYYDGKGTEAIGGCYGCVTGHEKTHYVVSVLKDRFEKFLSDIKCSERLSVLREWRNGKRILSEKDHYYAKEPRFGGARCLRIRFSKLSQYALPIPFNGTQELYLSERPLEEPPVSSRHRLRRVRRRPVPQGAHERAAPTVRHILQRGYLLTQRSGQDARDHLWRGVPPSDQKGRREHRFGAA